MWRPTRPSGPHWRHELKFDGWRVQARKTYTEVVVLSRLGNDISHRAPDVVRELARLPTRTFVLDGELIAVAQDGRPWFEATGLARQRHCLCAFDLLWLMGEDLRPLALSECQRRLAALHTTRWPRTSRRPRSSGSGTRAVLSQRKGLTRWRVPIHLSNALVILREWRRTGRAFAA